MTIPGSQIPYHLQQVIDKLADQFEAEHRNGSKPRIESYLAEFATDGRTFLLRELLRLEVELRRSAGESPTLDEYLQRFPENRGIVVRVFGPDSQRQSDRNLLFGVIALQLDHVTRDQLVDGLGSWVVSKNKSLGKIFVERGVIDDETKQAIEKLVDKRVKKDNQDRQLSLASLAKLPGGVIEELRQLGDEELNASLADVDETFLDTPTTAFVGGSSEGRFKILRQHDAGGLGVVYLAQDEELNRAVAIKRIQERLARFEESRARFQLESEITGGLEHPGIVPVYGRGHLDDGSPYYAMRFIRGKSLKQLVDEFYRSTASQKEGNKNVQFRKLLSHFADVCDTVGYAHARGVMHRDIKPQNIMVGKYGETLVVDWGVAKPIEDSNYEGELTEGQIVPMSGSTGTRQGQVFGTPAFMAPEQARGDLSKVGIRSDIYGLGATLYYIMTGRPPYEGEQNQVLKRVIQAEAFNPPRRINQSIPKALQAIALKALNAVPDMRYASAEDLRDDLERWLADEPNSAFSESWLKVIARKTGIYKQPLVSAVLAYFFVVDLAAGLFVLWSWNRQFFTTTSMLASASLLLAILIGGAVTFGAQVGGMLGAIVCVVCKTLNSFFAQRIDITATKCVARGVLAGTAVSVLPFMLFVVYLIYPGINDARFNPRAYRYGEASAYKDLAWLQAVGSSDARDSDAALLNAQMALDYSEGMRNHEYLDTLAAAQAAAGRFSAAATSMSEALKEEDLTRLEREEFEQRLELYKREKPYFPEQLGLIEAYRVLAFYQVAGFGDHRNLAAGRAHAEKACQLSSRQDVDSLAALAACHACEGDFQMAVETQSEAIKISEEYGGYDQDGLRRTLSKYQNGQFESLSDLLSGGSPNDRSVTLPAPWRERQPTYRKQTASTLRLEKSVRETKR